MENCHDREPTGKKKDPNPKTNQRTMSSASNETEPRWLTDSTLHKRVLIGTSVSLAALGAFGGIAQSTPRDFRAERVK